MKNRLIFDIGNTRAKVAVVSGGVAGVVMEEWVFDNIEKIDRAFVVAQVQRYEVRSAIVSSTGDAQEAKALAELLKDQIERVILFDGATPIPIKNSYATPATLGRDRLAAAIGAVTIAQEQAQEQKQEQAQEQKQEQEVDDFDAIVVVDMGTAITVDVVSKEGGFEGGAIAPGVKMRLRALHQYTAALPLIEPTNEQYEAQNTQGATIAKSTNEAMIDGVINGVQYEIEGRINSLTQHFKKISVFLTGGDAKHFVKRIKNPIFALSPALVIKGLNRILEYNER